MKKAMVIKDFGEAIDKKTNKPKYGFRPTVGKAIRMSDEDFAQVKADGLVKEYKRAETSNKMVTENTDK